MASPSRPGSNWLIVGSPWFLGKSDPVSEKFVAAFQAKYTKAPDQFAAQAYDAMFIAAAASTEGVVVLEMQGGKFGIAR